MSFKAQSASSLHDQHSQHPSSRPGHDQEHLLRLNQVACVYPYSADNAVHRPFNDHINANPTAPYHTYLITHLQTRNGIHVSYHTPPLPPPTPHPSSITLAYCEVPLIGHPRPFDGSFAPLQLHTSVTSCAALIDMMPSMCIMPSSHPFFAGHEEHMATPWPCVVEAGPRSQTAHEDLFLAKMCEKQFVEALCRIIDVRATRNEATFSMPLHTEPESVFFSVVKPQIVTKDYLARLVRYTFCSPAAFIVMLIHLDRVARKRPRLILTLYNMHRLIIAALTLSCKNLDEQSLANGHYASVGGIPTVREMNRLELKLLKYLEWDLIVCEGEYKKTLKQLMAT